MWTFAAVLVDLVHALLMAAWVAGLPLLFVHRWPRATQAYGLYAVAFILVSQASHWLLGECVFTTIARKCLRLASTPVSSEWFTVRVSRAVFGLAPSHRAVVWLSEGLILVTAVGMLVSRRALRRSSPSAHAVRDKATPALRA